MVCNCVTRGNKYVNGEHDIVLTVLKELTDIRSASEIKLSQILSREQHWSRHN